MPCPAEGVFARRHDDGTTLIGSIPAKPGIGGAVPAGLAKRTPDSRAAPGHRPGAIRPPARSSLTAWDLRVPGWKRGPAAGRHRRWSAVGRSVLRQRTRAPKGAELMWRLAALHPLGILLREGLVRPAPPRRKKQGLRSVGYCSVFAALAGRAHERQSGGEENSRRSARFSRYVRSSPSAHGRRRLL